MLAYNILLFLTPPHCVIQEITVCCPLKRNKKQKDNKPYMQTKRQRKYKSKAQQNTTKNKVYLNAHKTNNAKYHKVMKNQILPRLVYRECLHIAYHLFLSPPIAVITLLLSPSQYTIPSKRNEQT